MFPVTSEGWEGVRAPLLAAVVGNIRCSLKAITAICINSPLKTPRLSLRKGVSDVSIMTLQRLWQIYAGITPELVSEFYGLKGYLDNIPGVPGIGPKKAAALIVGMARLTRSLLTLWSRAVGKPSPTLMTRFFPARLLLF